MDGHSLVAAADLVVSAGGTMNREAVVLGMPCTRPSPGRLGGSTSAWPRAACAGWSGAEDLVLERRPAAAAPRRRRDPDALVESRSPGLHLFDLSRISLIAWLMDLRQLQTFVEVVDRGSFSAPPRRWGSPSRR